MRMIDRRGQSTAIHEASPQKHSRSCKKPYKSERRLKQNPLWQPEVDMIHVAQGFQTDRLEELTSINSSTTCQCPVFTFTRFPLQWIHKLLNATGPNSRPLTTGQKDERSININSPKRASFLPTSSIFNQTWTLAPSSWAGQRRTDLDNTAAVRSQRTPCPASALGLYRNRTV